ncbi:hypothetical protein MMC30_002222 [Trapelia coarctata]|nr:hypothetical protein [Trapelia coarctata]
MSQAPVIDSHDPYNYTSGRWLQQDELEGNARYIGFDFSALRRKVLELCFGATSITSYEKVEGYCNRAFIFTLDNGRRIVARLPYSLSGPPRLTTNSEVATIRYLQSHTYIPIPSILDWSDDAANPIGSESIIMEHVAGVRLHHRWPKMDPAQRINFIGSICETIKQMATIEFPAYGSIYFVDAPIDSSLKQAFVPGFCIGPNCEPRYWEKTRYYDFIKPNRGPWPDLTAYCSGLIDIGFSSLPPVDATSSDRPWYQGSIETHLRLLKSARLVIHELIKAPRIRDTAEPTLLHCNLQMQNIHVSDDDPTVITGIIDWQSTTV